MVAGGIASTRKGLFLHGMVAVVALGASSAFAAGQSDASTSSTGDDISWRISSGFNYSTGDYGSGDDTDVISTPLSLRYRNGPVSVRVSVPYVDLRGPGSILLTPDGGGAAGGLSSGGSGGGGSGSGSGGSGGGSIEIETEVESACDTSGSGSGGGGSGGSGSGGGDDTCPEAKSASKLAASALRAANGTDTHTSGIGDVTIAATYSFDFGNDLYADVTGKVKIPTASRRKRLGSGQTDFVLALDLIKDLGAFSVYTTGRHKFAGKSPTLNVRDTWGFGGGASYRVSDKMQLGVDLDWQQSAFHGRPASSDVTGWSSLRLSKRATFSTYGSLGLNRQSVNFAGGASISWRFD